MVTTRDAHDRLQIFMTNEYRGEVGVELVAVDDHYGTADMLRAVKDRIKGDFLVLTGDLVLGRPHLREVIELHRTRRSDATFLFKKVLTQGALAALDAGKGGGAGAGGKKKGGAGGPVVSAAAMASVVVRGCVCVWGGLGGLIGVVGLVRMRSLPHRPHLNHPFTFTHRLTSFYQQTKTKNEQDDEAQLDFIGLAEEKGQQGRVVMKVGGWVTWDMRVSEGTGDRRR